MELQSEKIDEITKAMVKAQFEMQGAKKGNKNPFFKSKYADLTEIITTLKEPFHNNGLCFFQSNLPGEAGAVIIVTTIAHESGQWVRSYTPMKPTKQDPQAAGSAITYGRRYGLQALAGIPAVDDDGNKASEKPKRVPDTPEKIKLMEYKKTHPDQYALMVKNFGREPSVQAGYVQAISFIQTSIND